MTKKHGIGWLNIPGYIPQTWNPIVGCSKISAGCQNCYAEKMAARLSRMDVDQYHGVLDAPTASAAEWNGKTALVESAIEKPLYWKKPRAIFVGSMTDLFHENTPDEWIDRVFAIAALCPQHIFIILTKRADRMNLYFNGEWRSAVVGVELERISDEVIDLADIPWPLPNVWLGVTAEDQEMADRRIPHLLRTPAAVRVVSCEPSLGPVDLRSALSTVVLSSMPPRATQHLDWVICGGESGPGARAMSPEWVRFLRDQCADAAVPFFFKQWGNIGRTRTIPDLNRVRPMTRAGCNFGRNGGDILDGRQHHEFPPIGKAES